MDILWNPWRYDYIKSGENKEQTENSGGCIFCEILNNPASDEEKFILHFKQAGKINITAKTKKQN